MISKKQLRPERGERKSPYCCISGTSSSPGFNSRLPKLGDETPIRISLKLATHTQTCVNSFITCRFPPAHAFEEPSHIYWPTTDTVGRKAHDDPNYDHSCREKNPRYTLIYPARPYQRREWHVIITVTDGGDGWRTDYDLWTRTAGAMNSRKSFSKTLSSFLVLLLWNVEVSFVYRI